MVSKIIKKTPSKSTNRRRNKRSPIKNVTVSTTSAAVLASINISLFTCRRRLAKIFNKLVRITTPILKKPGFKILKKIPENNDHNTPIRSLLFDNRLPPLSDSLKKTIVLDLDETLIHATADSPPKNFDFVVRPKINGEILKYYVLKRPGLDELLENLAEKFELVVFTAGLKEYASLVLKVIDRKELISHRFYRDSCTEVDGKYVKDLSEMGRELKSVVIVDDNPNAYFLQPENAIPVRPFIDDVEDRELEKLVKFFDGCDCFDDMRDVVKQYVVAGDDQPKT